jgi:hypothetical protein
MSQYVPGNPTVSGPFDFSVPVNTQNPSAGTSVSGRTVWGGNYVFVRVGGQKLMITSEELQTLLDQGQDVEVRTPGT